MPRRIWHGVVFDLRGEAECLNLVFYMGFGYPLILAAEVGAFFRPVPSTPAAKEISTPLVQK